MRHLFVDTSGWLALVHSGDAMHAAASEVYLKRFAAGWDFVTHGGVMLELGNSLSAVRSRHLAVRLKEILESSARMTVVHVSEDLYEAGWQLYAARPDKDWGIVDCISFALMRERGLSEALTADHHFEQAGFVKLL